MEKNYSFSLTEKFYDYGNGLRRAAGFLETWVIALCLDNSKHPGYDKGSNSHIVKQLNLGGDPKTLNYIKIYEIYLNELNEKIHQNINFSVFPNEIIQDKGKEWIRLFTITLWSQYYKSKEIYALPSNLTFIGKKIPKAIEILADIQDLEKIKILTEIRSQNLIEEEKNKQIEAKYNQGFQEGVMNGYEKGEQVGYEKGEAAGYQYGYQNGEMDGYQKGEKDGYQKGEMDGYQKGEMDGYQKGEMDGYQKGQINIQLPILDFYFNNYINGKGLVNIEIIGQIQIPIKIIEQRYGITPQGQQFIKELLSRNLIVYSKM